MIVPRLRLAQCFGLAVAVSSGCAVQRFDSASDDEAALQATDGPSGLDTDPVGPNSPADGEDDSSSTDATGVDEPEAPDAIIPADSDSEQPLEPEQDLGTPNAPSSDDVDASAPTPAVTDPAPSEATPETPTAPAPATDAPADEVMDEPPAMQEAGTEIVDECPEYPDQSTAGPCGCGFVANEACPVLEQSLAHRYSFEGTGTTAVDSVAGADGEIHNQRLDGSGALELDGSAVYVDLPPGMMSVFSQATFDMWVRWDGGIAEQRILNFGTRGSNGNVPPTFLSLTPRSDDDQISAGFRSSEGSAQYLDIDMPLPQDVTQHLTLVVDGIEQQLAVYVQGELVETDSTEHQLSNLEDGTNWLGRALYSGYPLYEGAIYEFRIHDVALTEELVALSDELGPDLGLSGR